MNLQEKIQEIKSLCSTNEQQYDIYKKCPYSISKMLEKLKKPFDSENVAKKVFNKHFNNPESEYYHMSVEEILAKWKNKSEVGTLTGRTLDNYIGMILETHESDDIKNKFLSSISERAKNKCLTFNNFYNANINNKLEFISRELMLFDTKLQINGRLDALFLTGNKLLLIDWKNTEKISIENSYEKMKGPLYEYDASDLNSYTIQLYSYVYMLKNTYNIEGVQIIPLIVQIGEFNYNIYSPKIPYSDTLLECVFEYAKNEINKSNQLNL